MFLVTIFGLFLVCITIAFFLAIGITIFHVVRYFVNPPEELNE